MSGKECGPVDRAIGAKVRDRRLKREMSQEALAGKLGVTFQQIQKYEKGVNRIAASRLYELSRILDTPVHYFFKGLDEARA